MANTSLNLAKYTLENDMGQSSELSRSLTNSFLTLAKYTQSIFVGKSSKVVWSSASSSLTFCQMPGRAHIMGHVAGVGTAICLSLVSWLTAFVPKNATVQVHA